MKIYIETEMTEMPKGCFDCPNTADGRNSLVVCRYGMRHIANSLTDIPNDRPSWCPLREIDTTLPEIIHEMAEAQTTEKTLKVHTDKLVAEFQLKLVSVEFTTRR